MNHEIVSRRALPHWYVPEAMHFITFRLAGTIPRAVLEQFRERRESLLSKPRGSQSLSEFRARVHKQLFADYDGYLDEHTEIHWLDDARVAELVRRSLYFWHGEKYRLACWCVMPNHVHVLLQPIGVELRNDADRALLTCGECLEAWSPLSRILHSLKSYTAHEANQLLQRSGPFWQKESYDHWVRDDDELQRIVAYINANPVAAGLAGRPCEYRWCSAYDRCQHDGDESGWVTDAVADAAKDA